MSESVYLEPEQLAAQINVIQTRTMRSLDTEAVSEADRTNSQVCLHPWSFYIALTSPDTICCVHAAQTELNPADEEASD